MPKTMFLRVAVGMKLLSDNLQNEIYLAKDTPTF